MTNTKSNSTIKYSLLMLLVAAFWGTGNPALKIAVEATSPLYSLSIRFILAFLFFIIWKFGYIKKNIKRKDFKNMFIVALFITGAYIAAAYAMLFTTATNAGFFMATGVVYTPFVSYFVLKEKIRLRTLIPIGLVVVGIYFLSTAFGSISINPGDSVALLCAVFGAGMFVFTGKYAAGIDPIVASTLQFFYVGVICLCLALAIEPVPNLLELDKMVWGAFLFMSIFCTCLAYFIQNLSLKHVTPTYLALIFATEPIFGAVASFVFLGEALNLRGVFGATIIMISILCASLMENKK